PASAYKAGNGPPGRQVIRDQSDGPSESHRTDPCSLITSSCLGVKSPCPSPRRSVSFVQFYRPRREPTVTVELAEPQTKTATWHRRHLLGLEELSRDEIVTILDRAEDFIDVSQRRRKKRTDRAGKCVVTLFFEPSTRTRASSGFAAKRLGADTSDFAASISSIKKGESFIDTARNIEAMGIDVVIVRHSVPGAPHLLAQ